MASRFSRKPKANSTASPSPQSVQPTRKVYLVCSTGDFDNDGTDDEDETERNAKERMFYEHVERHYRQTAMLKAKVCFCSSLESVWSLNSYPVEKTGE